MRFILSGELERATDGMIVEAFNAWEYWSQTPSDQVNENISHGTVGVNRVIQQAMRERPDQAELIACRVIGYLSSPNINVAASAATLFQDWPQYMRFAEPHLLQLAKSESPHPRSEPGSARNTLRSLAFKILYLFNPEYARHADLRTARREYAQVLLEWAAMRSDPGAAALQQEAEQLLAIP